MNPKDFQSLFPETENLNPTKIFNDLKALQRIKKLTDEEFTTVLNDFSISKLKYKGYLEKPGEYLWKLLSNYATRKWSKKSLETSFEKLDSFEAEINEEPSFDYKSTQQVLKEFFKAVQRLNLREKQLRLCKIMVDLSEEMHDSYFDFMQDVNNAAIASGMSYDDVRQTLSRFRKSMRGQDDIKGMLYSIPKGADISDDVIELLLSFVPAAQPSLSSYRFSEEELEKMLWLKGLFSDNGFTFNPNRFPKVYYTDFEKFRDYLKNRLTNDLISRDLKNLYEEIFDETKWNNLFEGFDSYNFNEPVLNEARKKELYDNLTPHFLGIYFFEDNKNDHKCSSGNRTNEGVIILFSDRIEKLAAVISSIEGKDVNAIIDAIRFNVLIHEFGHWLTHWAYNYNAKTSAENNWECGYYISPINKKPDIYTHESYAQIINYWAVANKSLEKRILLEYLTPKNSSSEYRKYLSIIDKSKEEVLNKLKSIRNLTEYTDLEKYNFLCSKHSDIYSFIAFEIYRAIKDNNFHYGKEVQLENIERVDSSLLEVIFGLLRVEYLREATSGFWQIIFNKLNKDENIRSLWDVNKIYFGEFDEGNAKNVSFLNRYKNNKTTSK
jgi:hypothetical protein